MSPKRTEFRAAILREFERRNKVPKSRAVDALADVGVGHTEAQGGWLPLDPDPATMRRLVAAELVLKYLDGEHPVPPTKGVYRGQFYTNLDALLDDEVRNGTLAPDDIDEDVQQALTSFALGCWDENDFRFMRTLVPGFVASYFVLGTRS